MIVIGITGGVGAGKTSVLEYLRENTDSLIIVADQVANDIKEPGECCYEKLLEILGEGILQEDKRINRKVMAEMIFSDSKLLQKVNDIIHPAVKETILKRIEEAGSKTTTKVVFLEAALLIEAGYLPYLDELWYLHVDEKVRAERLKISREYSAEKIRNINKNQLSEMEFKKYADVIIENNGEFTETEEKLKKECLRLNLWK